MSAALRRISRGLLGLISASLFSGCLVDPIDANQPSDSLAKSRWVGSAPGWTFTLDLESDLEEGGSRIARGELRSNRPDCFSAGPVVMSVQGAAFDLSSEGQSHGTGRSFVRLVGTLQDEEFEGHLTLNAHSDDEIEGQAIQARCGLQDLNIVFTRQPSGS